MDTARPPGSRAKNDEKTSSYARCAIHQQRLRPNFFHLLLVLSLSYPTSFTSYFAPRTHAKHGVAALPHPGKMPTCRFIPFCFAPRSIVFYLAPHLRPSSIVLQAPLPRHNSRKGMFTSLWMSSLNRDSSLRAGEARLNSSSRKRNIGAHWEAGLEEWRKM